MIDGFFKFPSLSGKTSIRTKIVRHSVSRQRSDGFHPFQGRPPFGHFNCMLRFRLYYDEAWRALTIVFGAPEGIDDESARQMHEFQEIIASVVLLTVVKFLESCDVEWSVINELCGWQAPAIS